MSARAAKGDTTEQSIIELRGAMADLNAAIDRVGRDVSPPERDRLIAGLQNAKVLLLRSAWVAAWGDPARFQSWINSGAQLPAPAGMPGILAGFRISASVALLLVVAAEMIGAQYGIGAFVLQAGNLMQTDQLMAGVVMLSVLGLLIAWGLGMVERSVLRWR